MINLTEKIKKLKDQGVVITIQRRAVLECLGDENFHPSTEEIYRHLKNKYPSLSLATVYTNKRKEAYPLAKKKLFKLTKISARVAETAWSTARKAL